MSTQVPGTGVVPPVGGGTRWTWRRRRTLAKVGVGLFGTTAIVAGLEYEYLKRESFDGIGGAPSTDNNIVLTSFRYYPF